MDPPNPRIDLPVFFFRKQSASGENETHPASSPTNTQPYAKYERNRFFNYYREIEILLDFY